MANLTVNLSAAEEKALGTVMADIQEWFNNFVHDRAGMEIDKIVKAEVERKIAAGESISGSKEDIVMAAQVQSVAEKNAEFEAQLMAKRDEQQIISSTVESASFDPKA